MATPGELLKCIADVTGTPEATVTTYQRSLREAGYITKGGRGLSAPAMSAFDAAYVLAAIGGPRFEKDTASKIVADYSPLSIAYSARYLADQFDENGHKFSKTGSIEDNSGKWRLDGFSIPRLTDLPTKHSFHDALAAVILSAVDESFVRARRTSHPDLIPSHGIYVRFNGPLPEASIKLSFSTSKYSYEEEAVYMLGEWIEYDNVNNGQYWKNILNRYKAADLSMTRSFTQETIYAVATLLKT